MRPVDDSSLGMAELAEIYLPSNPVQTSLHRGDQSQKLRRWLRPIPSGIRESDTESRIGSDETLNVEGRVEDNEAANVEQEVGCESPVINPRAKTSRPSEFK
jgi:hypothetical protein